jgi:hypothetical protein
MKRSLTIALLALTLLGLQACSEDPEPRPTGDVSVAWHLPNPCSALRLVTVEARLHPTGEELNDPILAETEACTNNGLEFKDVDEGSYTLVIEAFSGEGAALYWAIVQQVLVHEGEETAVTNVEPNDLPGDEPLVRLEPKPGALDITWHFTNGKLCSQNGVENVQITLNDKNGNLVHDAPLYFPCDPFSSPDEDRIVGMSPNPKHELIGILVGSLLQGDHVVSAYGLDEDGDRIYNGFAPVYVTRGAIETLSIELDVCSNPGCE